MTQTHCFTVMELGAARAGIGGTQMINVAILGAGIGEQHLNALERLGRTFQVAAVVDQNTDRIEQIRQNSDFRALSSIQDALDDPTIDVIDICLPPHLHVPTTLAALAAGKHVVCEKPLATSMQDVDRITATARSAGRQVFPVFQYQVGLVTGTIAPSAARRP